MQTFISDLQLPAGVDSNAMLMINRTTTGIQTKAIGISPLELITVLLDGAIVQDLPLPSFDNALQDPDVNLTGWRASVVTLLVESPDHSNMTFISGLSVEVPHDANTPAGEPDYWFMLPTGCHLSINDAMDYGSELQSSLESAMGGEHREPTCNTVLPPGATCQEKCNNEAAIALCRLSQDFNTGIRREFRNTGIRYAGCGVAIIIGVLLTPATGPAGLSIAAVGATCILGNAGWNLINVVDKNHDFDRNKQRIEEDRLRCVSGC